jgi:very-short-patch-repair endonuclease
MTKIMRQANTQIAQDEKTLDFIRKAKLVHGDKYDYSKSNYTHADTKIEIICKKHGSFMQIPSAHIGSKHGCLKCSLKNRKYLVNTEDFIKKAKLVHGDKYDYSKVVYTGARNKVKIICKMHGKFEQAPGLHLKGNNCFKCGIIKARSNIQSTDKYIAKAKLVHGDRYDYSKVEYKHWNSKIEIICKKHGSFKLIPHTHLASANCPKCSISKGEIKILNFLNKHNIKNIKEQTFKLCSNIKKLRFDFYLPEHNLCIEFDGRQHFQPVEYFGGMATFLETVRRDTIKNHFCEDNKIGLLRISYKEFNKVEYILSKRLLGL